jgi:PAS domain S-box-containing protein
VAHIGSWRLDVRKNKLTLSDENHRIFGIPPGTLMTYETFFGIVHPDDREYVDRKWTAALKGEPYSIEHRIVVDGAVKWVRERAELEFDPEGQLLGGFGTTQDITGRKEMEEALRRAHDKLEARVEERTATLRGTYEQLVREIGERQQAEYRLGDSEARFAAFMENLPGLAVMRDVQGRYLFANRAWEETMGLPPGAWQGKTPADLWDQEWAAELQNSDFQVISSGEATEQVEVHLLADGPRHFLTKHFPIQVAEGLAYMVGAIAIDITARQRAEEALKESERKLRYLAEQLLTAQENERKRLASELHDELGHALLALKLHLSSIEKKLPPEQQKVKEEIRGQLDYIQEVIEEVRRLYHDLSPGDLEDLGLTKALLNLIHDFAGHVPKIIWDIDLTDLEGLFPPPVQTIIYRIVQEALTNIGKHAHAEVVTICATKEFDQVHFVIQDDGAGFNVQEVGSRQEGRGLGLAAMEERLKMVGGSFEIHSREQEGARLSFTVPTLKEGGKP